MKHLPWIRPYAEHFTWALSAFTTLRITFILSILQVGKLSYSW